MARNMKVVDTPSPNPIVEEVHIDGLPSGSQEITDGAVTTVKLADKAVTAAKIADGVIPTVPGNASTSADGLMSKEDKAKLDGVASGANAYTLPAATTSTIGGVKQAAHVDGSDGAALVAALVNAGIMAAS